jgi:hypothetical protein
LDERTAAQGHPQQQQAGSAPSPGKRMKQNSQPLPPSRRRNDVRSQLS